MEWFNNLDNTIKVALITGMVAIIVAIINGVFGLFNKGKAKTQEKKTSNIEQISTGSNNVVIGVQNNYQKEN